MKQNIYFGNFKCREDVEREFEVILPKSVNIVFASYEYGDYDGSAFVLFKENGKLFEVNSGHCSCYGLEGTWSPELTTAKSLQYVIDNGKKWSISYSVFTEGLTVLRDVVARLVRWEKSQEKLSA